MGAAREKDQADFDLERFVDMFDEAMTSRDPRVIDTLRSLMMIVTLTRPETPTHAIDRERGPLRRLFEDVRHLNRRLHDLEGEFRNRHYREAEKAYEDKYTLAAAAQMAQSIDADVMQSIACKINGGNAGLNLAQPKGLLKK